ncbi:MULTISPECIES: helix-turn-helix domain-containing protein [Dyella]|uniref:DNA-binding protein n=2 Tax=Dyella TaxID=231454 RepID=A0A4R0YUN7_9GAMM|nr:MULTISPECIES: helix-turn-helix domain-containing protein [Dyella]TBR39267.1 DNA-binding protein [Dyella terrae]TCI13145.1 DNA-binding protein [Dyella soli]
MSDLLYYSTKEAAGILKLSPRTLENLRNKRQGPDFIKFGSRVLYSEEALKDYVSRNLVVTKKPRR